MPRGQTRVRCVQVVDGSKGITDTPEWFRGCKLNYAENLLRWNDDHVAYVTAGDCQFVSQIYLPQSLRKFTLER